MPLETKGEGEFFQDFINEFATEADIQPVFSPQSVVPALANAAGGIAIFQQFQAQYTTFFARATTSNGPDLDSWMAQFRFPRDGASFASGAVTLSVSGPQVNQLVIPVGTIVQSIGGAVQYQLVPDTTQSAYNVGLNAYVLPASSPSSPVLSINASVQALVAGSASNVLAGQLIQFAGTTSGVSAVINNAPISNGEDQESDDAYRNRFFLYINSLSKGTYQAILEACLSTFPTFTYNILSNLTPENITIFGFFTVVVNNPGEIVSSGQLAQISNAVENVRAWTIQSAVVGAIPVKPSIGLNVSVPPGTSIAAQNAATAAAQLAVIGLVDSLLPGAKLYLTAISDAAFEASTLITSVQFSSIKINGVQTDLSVDVFHVIQADLTTVTVGTYAG